MKTFWAITVLCVMGAILAYLGGEEEWSLLATAAAIGGISIGVLKLARAPTPGERRRARGLCAACGYDLRGNLSGVCPECGVKVLAD